MKTNIFGNQIRIDQANYSIDYVYDNNGNISQEITRGDINKTTTYTYDSITNNITQQIIVYEDGQKVTINYAYDSQNNIINVTSVIG